MKTKIDHPSFIAELLPKDIFSIYYKPNTSSTLTDLSEGYQAYLDMCNHEPSKVLIEVGKSAYFDIEANQCLKEGKVLPKAEAIVTNSLAIRLVVDYYLYSRKNKHQVRIFKTREQAIAWLANV